MTLGASTFGDELGGWATGCLVLLIGVWLFLALLGIRNSRFPWRIAGGAAFVLGTVLWLGLHPSLASAWHLDAGWLGWRAQIRIADPLASSTFALNALGALLLLCSTIGLLVAIDWLPLLPLVPLLTRVDQRLRHRAGRDDAMLRASAAPALEREARSHPIAPPRPAAPDPVPAAATTPAPAPSQESVPESIPVVEPPTPLAAAEATTTDAPAPDAPSATNWARFRPRTSSDVEGESPVDLPMDNPTAATHNSSTPEGETRSPPEATATNFEAKDETVQDQDNVDAELANGSAATSLAPPEEAVEAVESDATSEIIEDASADLAEPIEPDEIDEPEEPIAKAATSTDTGAAEAPESLDETAEAPSDTELAPRRKSDEPEEEPAEEPGEGDEDEDEDKEEDEDADAEPDDEDDEDWDDDEEEKEDDEEWEEDDEEKKEGEEDKEEDEDEDDEEDEDEDDEEDEDWDEDDEDEEEEKGDEEPKDASRADEPLAASAPEIAAEVVPEPVPAPVEEVESVEPEVVQQAVPETVVPETVVVSDDEAPAPDPEEVEVETEPAAATSVELPPGLFKDLDVSERALLARAVELLLGIESVSLSKLQRELGITYYAAARVFERLEKEGFIAPYSGSLARPVTVTRADWEKRRQA